MPCRNTDRHFRTNREQDASNVGFRLLSSLDDAAAPARNAPAWPAAHSRSEPFAPTPTPYFARIYGVGKAARTLERQLELERRRRRLGRVGQPREAEAEQP